MSILFSVYFREGIVFAADKNATLTLSGGSTDVEIGAFTKVLGWPNRQAVVGWCGLGSLAGLRMDEWLRIFIATHRGFNDLDRLAQDLALAIQADFDRDHPADPLHPSAGLILHLGGFKTADGHAVPAMYHIHNISSAPGVTYGPAQRPFLLSEDVKAQFEKWGRKDYPARVRERLGEMLDERDHFLWFNNGYQYPAFNVLKAALWVALQVLRSQKVIPATPSLENWEAYCRMAVDMYGALFVHHSMPHERYVGGGVDSVAVPWPTATTA